jgi:hypothetical protein
MKLQRVESRSVGDRTYHKYVLTLPEELVREAGWVAGDSVQGKVSGSEIVLIAERGPTWLGKVIERQNEYDVFRDRISRALTASKSGLTWTQLRDKLGLPQRVPNNVWVRRLEADIGLLRVKSAGKGVLWKLR